MTSEKKDTLIYWLVTSPFVLVMLMSSIGYLMAFPQIVEAVANLGYPPYITKIIGTAKLLGVIAILYSRFSLLKEWAYAGFTINMVGAVASHILAGHSLGTCIVPSVLLALILTSYSYWKKRSPELVLNS